MPLELLKVMNEEQVQSLGDKIIEKLKEIYDPEIPVDIYELGLIYDVLVNEDNDAKILMTLTSPNCPVAETLPVEVEEKVKVIPEINNAEVEITFDPPWKPDMMNDQAREKLGFPVEERSEEKGKEREWE